MDLLNYITHEIKRIISLDSFISKKVGVSDLLLPICFVDDGIILNKDGSFSVFYWYSGVDINSSTNAELAFLNTNIFNNAFARLGDGWAMHLDLIRKESMGYINPSECFFTDPTSLIIDIERRFLYEKENTHYENEFIATFTYLPPPDITSKIGNWFIQNSNNKNINYEDHLNIFKDSISLVISDLASRVYTFKLNNVEVSKISDTLDNLTEDKLFKIMTNF